MTTTHEKFADAFEKFLPRHDQDEKKKHGTRSIGVKPKTGKKKRINNFLAIPKILFSFFAKSYADEC
jgi:hypothetical protein